MEEALLLSIILYTVLVYHVHFGKGKLFVGIIMTTVLSYAVALEVKSVLFFFVLKITDTTTFFNCAFLLSQVRCMKWSHRFVCQQ